MPSNLSWPFPMVEKGVIEIAAAVEVVEVVEVARSGRPQWRAA